MNLTTPLIDRLPRDLLMSPSHAPAYHRLAEYFALLITKGAVRAEERLPSENRLAQHFHVSRPTVRHALAQLAAAKLVRREQGRGTYIN